MFLMDTIASMIYTIISITAMATVRAATEQLDPEDLDNWGPGMSDEAE